MADKETLAVIIGVRVGSEELTDMDKEAETKVIEKWLRTVDKLLATKEGDKKNAKRKKRGKQ